MRLNHLLLRWSKFELWNLVSSYHTALKAVCITVLVFFLWVCVIHCKLYWTFLRIIYLFLSAWQSFDWSNLECLLAIICISVLWCISWFVRAWRITNFFISWVLIVFRGNMLFSNALLCPNFSHRWLCVLVNSWAETFILFLNFVSAFKVREAIWCYSRSEKSFFTS